MRMRWTSALVFVLLAGGCGSDSSGDSGQVCAPGESKACVGPAGCQGGQTCNAAGTGYLPCDCGSGTGGTSGASGAGGSAGADAAAAFCPTGLPGPELVEVQAPDSTKYCIDAAEVTFAQYEEFLGTNPQTTDPKLQDQDGKCKSAGFNIDSSCVPKIPSGRGEPASPVVCVDWCRASAYCRWADKRLCGKIGGGSLLIAWNGTDWDPFPDETMSQWANACGERFAGVSGMLTDPAEWEDACRASASGEQCLARVHLVGGCSDGVPRAHWETFHDIGFRCCHDGTATNR